MKAEDIENSWPMFKSFLFCDVGLLERHLPARGETCETSAGGRIDLHVILVLDIEGETDVKLAVLVLVLFNRIRFGRFPTYTL